VSKMEIEPSDLEVPERYKLLIGAIVPRPIALVSTISPDGRPNLAPFSFFTAVGSNPMTMLFCPATLPDGSEKDSLRNAKPAAEGGVGEFVVNAAVEPYAVKVAGAAERLAYGESEFELVGLTPAPSRTVRPPRVAESPVCFECRTLQVIRTNPGAPLGGNVVLGAVVAVFVADAIVDARHHVDPAGLAAIGRMGGLTYCTTRERFDLPMGRAALALPGAPPTSR
jgi:flavin reductase (DIM6/NTAB) family NADH-FMN oxidoreductase RutF